MKIQTSVRVEDSFYKGTGEVGLGTEYDIDQYYNILDIDFGITI